MRLSSGVTVLLWPLATHLVLGVVSPVSSGLGAPGVNTVLHQSQLGRQPLPSHKKRAPPEGIAKIPNSRTGSSLTLWLQTPGAARL